MTGVTVYCCCCDDEERFLVHCQKIKRGNFKVNPSLIRVLSLWLSSSFWLNYPHTEIKVAVFLLLISICSNYNTWVKVVQKYKRTKSDSEFKAHVDWTGWGQWLWWSPDYLVKYLMNYGQKAMKFGEDIHEMHITISPKSLHLPGAIIQHLLKGFTVSRQCILLTLVKYFSF